MTNQSWFPQHQQQPQPFINMNRENVYHHPHPSSSHSNQQVSDQSIMQQLLHSSHTHSNKNNNDGSGVQAYHGIQSQPLSQQIQYYSQTSNNGSTSEQQPLQMNNTSQQQQQQYPLSVVGTSPPSPCLSSTAQQFSQMTMANEPAMTRPYYVYEHPNSNNMSNDAYSIHSGAQGMMINYNPGHYYYNNTSHVQQDQPSHALLSTEQQFNLEHQERKRNSVYALQQEAMTLPSPSLQLNEMDDELIRYSESMLSRCSEPNRNTNNNSHHTISLEDQNKKIEKIERLSLFRKELIDSLFHLLQVQRQNQDNLQQWIIDQQQLQQQQYLLQEQEQQQTVSDVGNDNNIKWNDSIEESMFPMYDFNHPLD